MSSDRVVTDKVLFELVKDGLETGKRVQSISGTFGERVKAAVETKHLHAGAFAFVNRLNKMDEAKRNDLIASTLLYLDKMKKVWDSTGHVGDFINQAEDLERQEAQARKDAAREQEQRESVRRVEEGIKGVPDPDHPDDPEKVTTLADARKKREAGKRPARGGPKGSEGRQTAGDRKRAAKREAEAAFKSPAGVKDAADRAEAAHAAKNGNGGARVAGVEAAPGERVDEAGNHLPPDISGDWDAPPAAGDEPDGMPGAEPPVVH